MTIIPLFKSFLLQTFFHSQMRTSVTIISFFILLMSVSCNQEYRENKEAKAEIRKILDQQATAWNEGNIEKYMDGYLRSDSLRFASGGNVSYGWQTTLERYRKGYPDSSSMGKLIFSGIDITMISNDAALVFGRWELQRENDRPHGLFTLIFRKTKTGWRIVHDHTSSAK